MGKAIVALFVATTVAAFTAMILSLDAVSRAANKSERQTRIAPP